MKFCLFRSASLSLLVAAHALVGCTPAPSPGAALEQPAPSTIPTEPLVVASAQQIQPVTPVERKKEGPTEVLGAAKPPAVASSGGVDAAPPQPALPQPELLDAQGAPLSQTEARPSTDSVFFRKGAELLFGGIVKDDVEVAAPFFFPKVAYEQVKAIHAPGVDWERRLMAAFQRDLHEHHLALGKQRALARFVRVSVDESRVKWVAPGKEGNRVGYYRALRSVVVYEDAQKRERELPLTSMISWRGEWYVVHLSGVK